MINLKNNINKIKGQISTHEYNKKDVIYNLKEMYH
jgi:hypothetical protein